MKSSKKLPTTCPSKWKTKAPLYIKKSDKRYKKYTTQLKKWGFSDTETWALDSVVSEFILPRLIRFKEITNGYPYEYTPKKWNEAIDDMIFAFDWNLTCEEKDLTMSADEVAKAWKRHERGLSLFAKHFRDLWW